MAFAQNPQGVFIGKSGIDNVLLMLVGILFVVLLVLKHRYRHGHYHRLRLDVFLCIHFLVYGFGNDLYRFAPLRNFLLLHTQSYLRFRLTIIFLTVLPIYYQLVTDICRLYRANHTTRRIAP